MKLLLPAAKQGNRHHQEEDSPLAPGKLVELFQGQPSDLQNPVTCEVHGYRKNYAVPKTALDYDFMMQNSNYCCNITWKSI